MKIQFKGTEGDWEINPRASRNVRCGNITIANCSSGQDGDREDEEKANAKLISAAPDMLNVLQYIYEMNDGVGIALGYNADVFIEKVLKKALM